MQLLTGLFLLVVVNSAFALPARNPDDDAEYVPAVRKQGSANDDFDTEFTGVVDTGSWFPFYSVRSYNPFRTGFFDNFEDLFKRLRTNLLSQVWTPSLELDPSEGNTTSVVKVIDGHKVEINDTVYTKSDDAGNSFFKVRLINIRPLDSSEETTTVNPGEDKDKDTDKSHREEVEKDSENNEILGNIDSAENIKSDSTTTINAQALEDVEDLKVFPINYDSVNENDGQEAYESATTDNPTAEGIANDNTEITHTKPIAFNKITGPKFESLKVRPAELGAEEYSGEFFAQLNSAPDEPILRNGNAEILEGDEEDNYWNHDGSEFGWLVENHPPVDLSNDIAVNEMLADQGAPFHPDAEVFSVDEFVPEFDSKRFHYEAFESGQPQTNINFTPIKK